MILDFKIFHCVLIEYWWYNTLTRENNWFLNVFVKSNFATPTPFGSVSCFVVGICLSNYNLNSILLHRVSFSKGYQWYLMHREVLGSIWKIGRCPIKVAEVLLASLDIPTVQRTDKSPLGQKPTGHKPTGQKSTAKLDRVDSLTIFVPVGLFLPTIPRWCFFCRSFMLFLSCFCYDFVRLCLLVPCGHLLGRADLLALVCDV